MPAGIAITGVRTFLGRRLAERLAGGDATVVGLDLFRPQSLLPPVRFQPLDLTGPAAAAQLAEVFRKESVDVVVHTAFRREPTPDLEADHELDTIGSLHVLHACAAAGVKRLVIASTTQVYGARPDNPNFLTESHPLRGHPHAHSVQNRVEMEGLVADWARRHPEVTVSVLRPCWIFGPSYQDAAVRYFARPVVAVPMGCDPLIQLVHEEDVVAAFEQAALAAHPGAYNIVAEGVVPLSVLLRSAGKRVLPVPPRLLRRLNAIPSQAQTGDPPDGFTDYLRYLWVADGARGWAAFGRPLYSTRETWSSFVGARRLGETP
jgi:UDP-glucose 4-epimerase